MSRVCMYCRRLLSSLELGFLLQQFPFDLGRSNLEMNQIQANIQRKQRLLNKILRKYPDCPSFDVALANL